MKQIIKILVMGMFFLAIVPIVIAVCNDNPDANLYTGNFGTYGDERFILNSSCFNDNTVVFHYCVSGVVETEIISCPCSEGKCIASSRDVFYWIEHMWEGVEWLRAGMVTEELLHSSVDSWVKNGG
ncbi:unnamed protein product [marine sediment metagenome]|uniref:Uncharacterized protein n=1 Tax=marine sediment metagenome TaxID=412755 RepID=X1BTE9_9ZZZZ